MTRRSKDPIKKSRFQAGDTILTILFFATMGLTIWDINIYRVTIVETKYLFATIVFGIFIAFVALSFLVKSSYSTIWTFLIKAAIGGGLFYFAFLFINQHFADRELQTEQFVILKKGTLGRGKSSSCFQPYVDIDFNGTEKCKLTHCSLI